MGPHPGGRRRRNERKHEMSENQTGVVEAAEVRPGLYLIPGHHPASMWTDANVPNIIGAARRA